MGFHAFPGCGYARKRLYAVRDDLECHLQMKSECECSKRQIETSYSKYMASDKNLHALQGAKSGKLNNLFIYPSLLTTFLKRQLITHQHNQSSFLNKYMKNH